MNTLLLPVLLLVCGADDKPSAPKLPLGKDTTYVVGPLDKHGYIDYEAALNAELSKGVTAENNAMVLLVRALGPAPEGGDGMPAEFFKWLDIPIPPKDGDYLVNLYKVGHDQLGLSQEQMEKLYEFQSRATQRPWQPKDAAPLVEWLKANEKPLAVAIEASKRPKYFHPLCTRRKEGEPSNLIGTLLPAVQKCRELASLLTCRAMLRLQERKFDDAWNDLLACHRLGRLMGRGATLIESLVGIAICQIASNATLAYLEHADLPAAKCLDRMKELRALPPIPPMAEKIALGERFVGLDALQMIRRGGVGQLEGLTGGRGKKPTAAELKALDRIDWGVPLTNLNKWYDRIAAAMRLPDRTAREKAFAKMDEDLKALKTDIAENPEKIEKLLQGKKDPDKEAGKIIGDMLISLMMPAVQKVQQAHDRSAQTERNLLVAFTLAAYKKDTGRYPAKLADLAPKYLKEVPGDLFSGKPLIYKPTEKGYLFYSVGPNGKDDGGRWYSDDPQGDDPGVKMPLPELKK